MIEYLTPAQIEEMKPAGRFVASVLNELMHSVEVERRGDVVIFDFHANAFLHHMIRNLVGSLVYVGMGRKPVGWMSELLAARNRTIAAPTFAPDGLYLCGVEYPPRWPLPGGGRIIAAPQLLLP